MSPPIPTRTSPPARAASSSGSRSTRWCRCAPSTSRAPAARARHARDASRQPAAGYRARSSRASGGCSTWSRGCATTGVTTLRRSTSAAGSGIRYRDERPMDPGRLGRRVVPLIGADRSHAVLEPGRFLVGSAGVLLTRVLSRKHSGGKEFVIVDAGMNDLVRPSHYQAYHEIVEVEAAAARRAGGRGRAGVRDRRLPGPGPDASRAGARASAWRCWAPAPMGSSWPPTTTAGRGRRR